MDGIVNEAAEVHLVAIQFSAFSSCDTWDDKFLVSALCAVCSGWGL